MIEGPLGRATVVAFDVNRLSLSKVLGLATKRWSGFSGSRTMSALSWVFVWLGLLIALLGVALNGSILTFANVALVAGASLLLISFLVVQSRVSYLHNRHHLRKLQKIGRRVEQRIEQLEDARWRVHDNTHRMRELLDAQQNIIYVTDQLGRLTFVNRSFCATFGVEVDTVLETQFRPIEIERGIKDDDCRADSPLVLSEGLRSYLNTVDGPRWFAWSESEIPSVDGLSFDRQVVGTDITNQLRIERELSAARDQAQSASRAKSRFLASMSHEIRTPMNGILGMGGLLLESKLTNEQQTYVEAVNHSAQTLMSLIDEILDFSRIEAGHLKLDARPFSPYETIQSVVELLAPQAHQKGLELAWLVDPEVPKALRGDRNRFRQVLTNLLGNAIKYTDRGGVSVSLQVSGARSDGCRLRLTIEDTGVGLDTADLTRIFGEFERAGESEQRYESGTGLGLAIARQIVRAMGGDISVSASPGHGACFVAEFDLSVADPEPVLQTYENALNGLTVLIASGHLIERRSLAQLLMQLGAHVFEANEASKEAIGEALTDHLAAVDILLIDADESPIEAGASLAELRELAPGKRVTGVVLTGAIEKVSVQDYRAVGFSEYLIRPVRPLSLYRLLTESRRGPTGTANSSAANYEGSIKRVETHELNVLLAEDNDINAMLATKMLTNLNCRVERVLDGREAVQRVKSALRDGNEFDVILMDVHMPEMDGLQATREIREFQRGSAGIPATIVAVTANAFAEDREQCFAAGMDYYLAKPFDPAELAAILSESRNSLKNAS